MSEKEGAGCGAYMLAFVSFLVFAAVVGKCSDRPTRQSSTKRGPTDSMAIVLCKNKVRDRLKSPASADFPIMDVKATRAGSTFTVSSYVDAKNAFGAEIRTHYTCVIDHVSGDNWRLVNLTMR